MLSRFLYYLVIESITKLFQPARLKNEFLDCQYEDDVALILENIISSKIQINNNIICGNN